MADQRRSEQQLQVESPLAVLLVDEDVQRRELVTQSFRDLGFAVRSATSMKEAMAGLRTIAPSLTVVQIGPTAAANLHLVTELRSRLLGARIIMIDSQGYLITQRAITSGAKLLCTSAEDLLDFLTLGRITHWQSGALPAERADHSLARAEWGHIRRVLDDCGGNVTEAARLLGIHRRSLQRKLRKHPPRG